MVLFPLGPEICCESQLGTSGMESCGACIREFFHKSHAHELSDFYTAIAKLARNSLVWSEGKLGEEWGPWGLSDQVPACAVMREQRV